MNPQYFINISDPDPYDDEDHCPVVISIAQKQKQRKSEHAIGFKVFKCDLIDKKLDTRFFSYNQAGTAFPKKYCNKFDDGLACKVTDIYLVG